MMEAAAHRPKPTGDNTATVLPDSALQFRRFYFCLWAITAILAAAIVAVMAVSAIYGEKIVTTLLATAPENLVQRAKSFELRGNEQAAIELYREALDYEFADRDMRLLAAISLGDLLVRQELYEDALRAYRAVPDDEFRTSGLLTGFVRALESTGDLVKTERMARRWLEMAVAEGNLRQQVWANSALGTAALRSGRDMEALIYFQAAGALDPKTVSHVSAARILSAQGNHIEALEVLETLLAHVEVGTTYAHALEVKEIVLSRMAQEP